MERFFNSQQQERILLGFNNNNNNRRASTNPSTPQRNSDVDFNDVFGGPPRRSSVNEAVSGEEGGGGGGEAGWCRWLPEREKPVFGEDSGIRKRYPNRNNDFFDDIFGGEESPSVCSTPKKRDAADPFASPSTFLSPSRLAPELLASSLPPSFSLPAKLTKGVDLQTFGSPTRSRKQLDLSDGIAASNGLGSSDSHLSRFSTQAAQHKELENDLKPSYGQSLLSKEFSNLSPSDEADKGSNMKHNTSMSEVSPNTNSNASDGQFHFSIYKWASKGVPLAMPLRTERTSRTKDKVKLEKCSSAKEWMVSEITTGNDSPVTYNSSSLTINIKQDVSTTQDYDEMTRTAREENITKSSKKLSSIFYVPPNPKKQDEKQKTIPLRDVGYSKVTSKGSFSPGEDMGKGRVKGKVKDFVRIFNQEAVTIPRVDSKSQLQDSTYKHKGALRTKNDVEGEPEQSQKEISTTNMSANNLSQQDDISVSASAIPDMSFAVVGDKDESFQENFMIQVLAQDEAEILQNLEIQEIQEIQIIDSKIQQWSKGKEGNIRSMLSTLQYVLWPECGWKPVPLVDIIEGNAVKRAYQRALLYLHPDKLQQKGAASDQKYIAEKVFDILQEAWTQFNMLGAL